MSDASRHTIEFRPCEPVVTTGRVGWIAVSPVDHPYRIGVVGGSEEEARRRFAAAVAAWQELRARRDPDAAQSLT